MASNTGWQIINAIMATNANNQPLDRDGIICNLVDSNGIPISVTGNKQRVYLRSGILGTNKPAGQSKTYAELFDPIVGAWTLPTNFPNPNQSTEVTRMIDGKSVVIARFRGFSGQTCQAELFQFQLPINSRTIPASFISSDPQDGQIVFFVTSKYLGENHPFAVEIESFNPVVYADDNDLTISTTISAGRVAVSVNKMYSGRSGVHSNQTIRLKITQEGSGKILYYTIIRQPRLKFEGVDIRVIQRIHQRADVEWGVYQPRTQANINTSVQLGGFPSSYPFNISPQSTKSIGMQAASSQVPTIIETRNYSLLELQLNEIQEGDSIVVIAWVSGFVRPIPTNGYMNITSTTAYMNFIRGARIRASQTDSYENFSKYIFVAPGEDNAQPNTNYSLHMPDNNNRATALMFLIQPKKTINKRIQIDINLQSM